MEEIKPKTPEDERSFEERLALTTLLALELEGVLTDGRVYTDNEGRHTLVTHRSDEIGLAQWLEAGCKILVLSRTDLPAAEAWSRRIGADYLAVKDARDKAQTLRIYAHQAGLKYVDICYMGADLDDLTPMMMVGTSACPPQAPVWLTDAAEVVTTAPAGAGAVRELVDLMLSKRNPKG